MSRATRPGAGVSLLTTTPAQQRQRQADSSCEHARQTDRAGLAQQHVSAVTTKPAVMPASAPQALVRFHQIGQQQHWKGARGAECERPEEQLQRIGRRRDRQPGGDEGDAQQRHAAVLDAGGVGRSLVGQAVDDVLRQDGCERPTREDASAAKAAASAPASDR